MKKFLAVYIGHFSPEEKAQVDLSEGKLDLRIINRQMIRNFWCSLRSVTATLNTHHKT